MMTLPSQKLVWTASELQALWGKPLDLQGAICAVKIDSRLCEPGDLFIALQGPHQSGDQFVRNAFDRGAVAALVSDSFDCAQQDDLASRIISVPDTLVALQQLGAAGRARTQAKIVGITGSFGKTSVKEALRLVLTDSGSERGVTASERSFNNHWGVPLTLSLLRPDDAYGLIEIGMNNAGEIAPLSCLVRPDIALITNVRCMHLESLGSLQAIARAKSEIFAGIAAGGIAVLNHDDEMFGEVQQEARGKALEVISFGCHPEATWHLQNFSIDQGDLRIQASFEGRSFDLTLKRLGSHWALNTLGILATAHALGVDPLQAIDRLKSYQLAEGRGQHHCLPWNVEKRQGEIVVIDESYNAGPDSMTAALTSLGQMHPQGSGRRIAILGDMRELGSDAAYHHRALAAIIQENAIDQVFTCGVLMNHLYQALPYDLRGGHAEEVADLVPEVLKAVQEGDIIMIKGSKGQYAQRGRMYGFVDALRHQSNAFTSPHSG